MKDIFTGKTLTVLIDNNKVKEVACWINPITTITPDGLVKTNVKLVINYTQDNIVDDYVYNNRSFILSILSDNEEQIIHEGYFKITKREVIGEYDEVVKAYYDLESIQSIYPFTNQLV